MSYSQKQDHISHIWPKISLASLPISPEYFAWEVEDEVESEAAVLEVEDEVAADSENSADSDE